MTDLSTTLLATGSSPTHPERVRDKLGRLQMAPLQDRAACADVHGDRQRAPSSR